MYDESLKTNLFYFHSNESESSFDCVPQTSSTQIEIYNNNKKQNSKPTLLSHQLNLLKRKHGRKSQLQIRREQMYHFKLDVHSIDARDNMSTKIKTFYHKFLIQLINNFLKEIKDTKELKRLSSEFSTSKHNKLLTQSIKKLLSGNINKRYKKYNINHNKEIIEYIYKHKLKIIELLDLPYQNIYEELFIKGTSNKAPFCNFQHNIPKEYILDILIQKQKKEIQETFKNFAYNDFILKIQTSVNRQQKANIV